MACYNPDNRHERQENERFHRFDYADLLKRDKLSLDLFWLRDKSLEDADDLPPPDVLIMSIIEDLQATIEQLTSIVDDLNVRTSK